MKEKSYALFFVLLFCSLTASYGDDATYFAPFQNQQQIEDALKKAKVIKEKVLGTGITHPLKLTLNDGTNEFNGVFKSIDERRQGVTHLARGSSEMDFKDSWMFDVAAYELDKLLGLNMVPVTVERNYNGKKGMLQWWVKNAMTEKDRKEKGMEPVDPDQWNQAIYKVRLFDNLVHNMDRNLGNLLITDDWKVWMIDHSRCFKNSEELKSPGDLKKFSVSMMDAIRKLDERSVKEHCGEFLTTYEIQSMLKRRDAIVKLYDRLYAEQGDAILFP